MTCNLHKVTGMSLIRCFFAFTPLDFLRESRTNVIKYQTGLGCSQSLTCMTRHGLKCTHAPGISLQVVSTEHAAGKASVNAEPSTVQYTGKSRVVRNKTLHDTSLKTNLSFTTPGVTFLNTYLHTESHFSFTCCFQAPSCLNCNGLIFPWGETAVRNGHITLIHYMVIAPQWLL